MAGAWLNVGEGLNDGLGEAEADAAAGLVAIVVTTATGLLAAVLTADRGAVAWDRCNPVKASSVTLATHTATTHADRITVATPGRRTPRPWACADRLVARGIIAVRADSAGSGTR